TVTMNGIATTDTTVNLSSSQPFLTLPASVLIPAGQRSVNFSITSTVPPSDTTVVITASTPAWSLNATTTVINPSGALTINPFIDSLDIESVISAADEPRW